MVSGFWQRVVADGHKLPSDRPLAELTAELTTMLGDPDPTVREEIALATLGTWLHEGVYDDLLAGLGDGMCQGLLQGLGQVDTDTVLTRSYSALVLAEVIERDNQLRLVSDDTFFGWGDRLMGWFVREQDLRGFVPGIGWLHAVAHGADALGSLARSPRFGQHELTVLLDVVADRLLQPTDTFWVSGEADRMALVAMHVMRRNVLPLPLLEAWLARLASAGTPGGTYTEHPYRTAGRVQDFLRSLQLQLAVGHPQPELRSDLLLVLVDHLARTNPMYLRRR